MITNEMLKEITLKEEVNRVDVIKAYTILYHAMINNEYDLFLYCASINLLNTFVKQEKKVISYSFKSRVHFMLTILAEQDIENVKISYEKNKDSSLLLVQIFDIQFSFHNIVFKDDILNMISKYMDRIKWDGIRKQNSSVTLFNYALSSNSRSNEARGYENLDEIISEIIQKYNSNEIILSKNGPVDLNGHFV